MEIKRHGVQVSEVASVTARPGVAAHVPHITLVFQVRIDTDQM